MRDKVPETDHDLVELLDKFNRKERYFLICNALGIKKFCLDEDFRKKLGTEIGIDIPPGAGVWMDYHLDWLAAAIIKWRNPSDNGMYCNPGQDNNNKLVQGNQEDVDLLIAFKDKEDFHLVFLEAKGYSPWDNKQMESKAKRLRKIFGPKGENYRNVVPHFCLTSPSKSKKLKPTNWPVWMTTYRWIELKAPCHRLTVARSEASGKPSKEGKYFSIKGLPGPSRAH